MNHEPKTYDAIATAFGTLGERSVQRISATDKPGDFMGVELLIGIKRVFLSFSPHDGLLRLRVIYRDEAITSIDTPLVNEMSEERIDASQPESAPLEAVEDEPPAAPH